MVFAKVKNNEVVKVGTIFSMLPNVSNPTKLTEQELAEFGVYKPVTQNVAIQPWQYVEKTEYEFVDGEVHEKKIIVDTPLENYKLEKKAEIKSAHNAIMNEGFTTSSGIKLDCRQEDINNFTNNLTFMEKMGLTETTVRDFNNQEHTFTLQEFEDMLKELGQHWQIQFNNKWTLDKKIDTATTHQEVNDIYWRKALYSDEMEFSHWEYHSLVSENNGVIKNES